MCLLLYTAKLLCVYMFRAAFLAVQDASEKQTTHHCLHVEFVYIVNKSADTVPFIKDAKEA